MARKGKQPKGDNSALPNSNGGQASKTKVADSQMWVALKHEDEDQLLSLLFDEIEDAESGELRRVQKPTARKAVSQLNAKRMLPLSYAVSEGLERAIVEVLLRAGAGVNKKDETPEQSTALHAACWNEDGEVIDLLLRAGADPRVVDAEGRTPLHVLATSNATSLMLNILAQVSSATASATEGDDTTVQDRAAPTRSPALQIDPMALLAMSDKPQGATVLHFALGESTYNFGVAQALCDYLERVRTADDDGAAAAAAVARLVSARTTLTGETPLHVLLSAANTEDAVVEALVRRLLGLGADPLVRSAAGQSIIEAAIGSRPGCNSKAGIHLYETLVSAIIAKDETACFLAEHNNSGHAVIHVALAAANTSAVKALCSVVPAAQAKPLLGDPVTANGITVVELLATSAGSAEMATALITANAVAREAYESLRQSHETLQAEQLAQREKEANAEEEDGDGEEGNDDDVGGDADVGSAGSAAIANLKRRHGNAGGGGGGLSRAQQARRARAVAAAQRKSQPAGPHQVVHEGGGGLFGGGELSTPVKVVGVLLLLSVFVSAYTVLFGQVDGVVQGV